MLEGQFFFQGARFRLPSRGPVYHWIVPGQRGYMRTAIFQVDAFTTRRFAGNPAAVMPLEAFLPDVTLQAIAAENNLAETAFLFAKTGTTGCAGSRRRRRSRFAATPRLPVPRW